MSYRFVFVKYYWIGEFMKNLDNILEELKAEKNHIKRNNMMLQYNVYCA